MAVSRRGFLALGASCVGAALLDPLRAQSRTRLVLLGTAGGPTPKVARSAPAQAIVAGDRIYLIDCGDGVARQLALAGLPLRDLRAIFLTHHHSDHNAGYGPLLVVGWTGGISAPIDVLGPPPLDTMTERLLEAHDYDIALRMRNEGRPPLAPLVRTREITAGGEIFRDDRVRVTAALNAHVPIEHSFAYRFDTADRSIVISGDTAYSTNVLDLARGADVLVHEVVMRAFFEAPDAPLTPDIRRHIITSHTDVEDAARLAAEAGVKTLVLTHFVPSEPTGHIPEDEWVAAARKLFKGEVIAGRDLMVI